MDDLRLPKHEMAARLEAETYGDYELPVILDPWMQVAIDEGPSGSCTRS